MTLLLREVVRFILDAIAWIGLEVLVVSGPALVSRLLTAAMPLRRAWGIAFLGGAAGAAIAVRLALPLAWAPTFGGRPLPVGWSLAGAVLAIGAAIATTRNEASRSKS